MQPLASSISASNANNAVNHVNIVQNLVKQVDNQLQQYHKLIELYRQQIRSMNSNVSNMNQQIHNTFVPLIESLYHQLETGMVQQQQENSNFQSQVTDLKKQKSVISQMINATLKKTQQLAKQIGNY